MEKNSGKNLTGALGTIGVACTLISAVTPIAEKIIDGVIQSNSHKKTERKVVVPELYKRGFPIDLEQAEKQLEDCGLKSSKSKLRKSEAKMQYKDCFDMQVLWTSPKQGSSIKEGSTVSIRYITEDVISESKKIFDEAQIVKAELKEKKLAARNERKEHVKAMMSNATEKTKNEIGKMIIKKKDGDKHESQ